MSRIGIAYHTVKLLYLLDVVPQSIYEANWAEYDDFIFQQAQYERMWQDEALREEERYRERMRKGRDE